MHISLSSSTKINYTLSTKHSTNVGFLIIFRAQPKLIMQNQEVVTNFLYQKREKCLTCQSVSNHVGRKKRKKEMFLKWEWLWRLMYENRGWIIPIAVQHEPIMLKNFLSLFTIHTSNKQCFVIYDVDCWCCWGLKQHMNYYDQNEFSMYLTSVWYHHLIKRLFVIDNWSKYLFLIIHYLNCK